MSKVLVRGGNAPDNAEVLSDSQFISTALEQMASTAISLKDSTESEVLLRGMADIMELMQEVLMKNNIVPTFALEKALELREQEGSFQDKKAVTKE